MPDITGNVPRVDHTNVVATLRKASELIAARGYQPLYGSVRGGPINISNALTLATDDYDTYLKARQAFSKNWGGPTEGLVYWETYKRRSKTEVLELLAKVIDRLENDEARPPGTAGQHRNSTANT